MRELLTDPAAIRAAGAGKKIGILTGGGDAQGMNAALRAAARVALNCGAQPYALHEGYQGMIDGDGIKPLEWADVSGILNRGGTVIGTYRSKAFYERDGRLKAAQHLIEHGIDRLVVVGGDGTLSGLDQFSHEWPELLEDLVASGAITREQADEHPHLFFAAMVGSIDNDLVGTDLTIGADSALHRIQDAIDAVASTAASHQRCFVVEVMGRHCGYLAIAAAISGGCDYVLLPERPPADGWEKEMCEALSRSREAGRKDTIVILAEGATDRAGQPITAEHVRATIEDTLGEETRITILGHVQRGGTPSAYDRWASTWLGYAACAHVLTGEPGDEGLVFGFHGDEVVGFPLVQAVSDTRRVPELIKRGDYEAAQGLRGDEFRALVRIFDELSDPTHASAPPVLDDSGRPKRIGVVHAGALAPGMNTATKTIVWLGVSRGYEIVGVRDGFEGLMTSDVVELTWQDADGWNQEGGAALGTRRFVPAIEDLYAIARSVETNRLDALVVIGGWAAYQGAALLVAERNRYPSLRIPIVCVPASIDNNLPGTQMAVGADTALNVIADTIDKIRVSASAAQRAFVIETMGRDCGYLALMGAVAGGAEQVYLNETGVTLADIHRDISWLTHSFDTGRTLFIALRNENANPDYTTDVLAHIIEQEGRGRYDTRTMVVGHIQQGGTPTPADRLLATRLADAALTTVITELERGQMGACCVGSAPNGVITTDILDAMKATDPYHQRPHEQWWLGLRGIVDVVNRAAG
ncbi:MAG: 6-phosphofructokinase [Propionibacteriaceae bacterium]|jgi:6-phosphofructokinase 1|nr:6-phosphofructokinase [Propionibacteriaceae bacterium]